MANSRARVALLLALTFLAGLAAGFAADRQPARAAVTVTNNTSAIDAPGRTGTTIERFADELGLTESQRADIAPVLEDTRRRMSELFEPVRPAYGELVDSARARIEEVLTPEQVTQYRSLLEREYGKGDDKGDDKGQDHDRD